MSPNEATDEPADKASNAIKDPDNHTNVACPEAVIEVKFWFWQLVTLKTRKALTT